MSRGWSANGNTIDASCAHDMLHSSVPWIPPRLLFSAYSTPGTSATPARAAPHTPATTVARRHDTTAATSINCHSSVSGDPHRNDPAIAPASNPTDLKSAFTLSAASTRNGVQHAASITFRCPWRSASIGDSANAALATTAPAALVLSLLASRNIPTAAAATCSAWCTVNPTY